MSLLESKNHRRRRSLLRPYLYALACLSTVSCVGQTQYEEARSAAEVQSEAHRRALLEMAAMKQETARLEAQLAARENAISDREDRLAQADLELEVSTQKQAAKGHLVDRLRDELARAGSHLKVFADEKEQLRQQLVAMNERAADIERAESQIERVAGIVRDLSVLEGAALGRGEIELGVQKGEVVLKVPVANLLASDGKQLTPASRKMAESLGKLASLHQNVGFAFGDTGGGGANVEVLRQLSEAMVSEGVDSARVSLEALPPASETGGAEQAGEEAQVVIRLSLQDGDGDASEAETDLGGPAAG